MGCQKLWMGILAAALLPLSAVQALSWRAVALKGADGVELWTSDGGRYPVAGKGIDESLLEQDLSVSGRLVPSKKFKPDQVQKVMVDKVAAYAAPQGAEVFSPGRKGYYDRTDRTIPEEQLKPGALIAVDMPEMGKSASSGGSEPVRMNVSLPEDYSRTTAHPVIIHFGGGTGGTGDWNTWRRIVGPDRFIIIAADYDHAENDKRGTLKIGTCRDFDSKIAYHALQILRNSTMFDQETVILAGMSSGAYSITDNLKGKPKAWQLFSGFCAIAGGSNTGSPKVGSRPVLFLMGQDDAMRHKWLDEAVEGLKKGRAEKLVVEKVPGVGHDWSEKFTPIILDWFSNFPALARPKLLEQMVKDAPNDKVRAVIEGWKK